MKVMAVESSLTALMGSRSRHAEKRSVQSPEEAEITVTVDIVGVVVRGVVVVAAAAAVAVVVIIACGCVISKHRITVSFSPCLFLYDYLR